jgi:oxygen-independent coproporphyrinogen-3 oxidase
MTPLGLYVHVPFCASRCGYCDFNTYTAQELGPGVDRAGFHHHLFAEVVQAAQSLGRREVSTVFVGGGTPTLLGSEALVGILETIRERFSVAPDAEITTEANPDSVDPTMLEQLREGGFTRISFGMQSAAPHVLSVLDRTHTPGSARRAAEWARGAGFEHINIDLIYGTPGETDLDLRASLEEVLVADVDHVSAYALIVEEGTALGRRVARGELPAPDDDVCADRYEIIDDTLMDAGMPWYEVSNWARPGSECRHNIGYWRNSEWWGVGPGAHSHVRGERWWNIKHPARYAAAVTEGRSPREGGEILTSEQRSTEMLMLGVRTREGVALDDDVENVEALVRDGLLEADAFSRGRAVLTRRGRLLTNVVVRTLTGGDGSAVLNGHGDD